MDKEQFDHIEILFRQAAMNVSPSANEAAWKKMEALLDREFHKKRRRAIFWWWPMILFFLFLGTISYYNYLQPVNNGDRLNGASPLLPSVNRTETHNKKSGLLQPNQQQDLPATSDQRTLMHSQHQSEQFVTGKQSGQDADKQPITRKNQTIDVRGIIVRKAQKNFTVLNNLSQVRYRYPLNNVNVGYRKNERSPKNALKWKITLPELISDSTLQLGPIDYTNPFVSKTIADTSLLNLRANVSNTSIQVKKIRRFYFVAAVAPDASAVKKIHFNEIHSRFGLGAGYQLTKKISLQTGIYAGRMIYTAGDGDYTIKPGSYISKIIKINADCYFYNVPLSLRYNALPLKKYNLYAVGGISSFWSKNETYDYHFLNRNGMYRNMVSKYKNNKSLFSAINLSLGFERSLSNVFYLHVEPYLLVPVSGIGEGKVKLHSAGLQFGIRYKPLRK